LVIVWTAIGAAPPTTTSPTRTGIDLRLLGMAAVCCIYGSLENGISALIE
jgi:hypothetical protein